MCSTSHIDFLSHFEGVGIGQVDIGWCDGQNEATRLLDIGEDHAADLLLNIGWLVPNGNLGQARQIDQGQIQN